MSYYFGIIAVSVLIYVTFWYFYGQRLGRLDVADEAWGLAQPYIVIVAMLIANNYSPSSIILLFLTLFWGYRLFRHLHQRHSTSSVEDIRYTEMRSGWVTYPRIKAYIYVFLLQGFLMYLLGIGSMFLIFDKTSWNTLSLIGAVIWVVGFVFEVIADKQLKEFVAKSENKGKIMDLGLWRYSRHPNYFGEIIMWWGIFIFAYISTGSVIAVISPLTITYLIIFVSGIPMTEKHFESNPLWKTYKQRTSALVPWPNKK